MKKDINNTELLNCISEISSTQKPFANIARKYGYSESLISEINLGNMYKRSNLWYPLRNDQYSIYALKQIRYSLKYEYHLSLEDIMSKYDIDRVQLDAINNGAIYFVSTEQYPLRNENICECCNERKPPKKFLDIDIVKDIHNLLQSEISVRDIAEKYGTPVATIHNINNGKCKKYILDGYKYPIRKLK